MDFHSFLSRFLSHQDKTLIDSFDEIERKKYRNLLYLYFMEKYKYKRFLYGKELDYNRIKISTCKEISFFTGALLLENAEPDLFFLFISEAILGIYFYDQLNKYFPKSIEDLPFSAYYFKRKEFYDQYIQDYMLQIQRDDFSKKSFSSVFSRIKFLVVNVELEGTIKQISTLN